MVGGGWLGRRVMLARTWPLFLLLVYVVYPEIEPRWAWVAAAITVLVIVINFWLDEGGEVTGNSPVGESATPGPVAPPLRTHASRLTHRASSSEGEATGSLFSGKPSLSTPVAPPLRTHASRITHHAIPLILFFATLTLYIFTLAPDILPADNGEFQYTGTLLGVAHPPGFPLYTVLSWLMTKLPLGTTPAYKINLLSAFTSAATVVLVYLAVSHLPLAAGKHAPRTPALSRVEGTHHASRIAGLAAALTLATSTTFWAQATTANIRSLTAFFAALAIYALLRHREEKSSIVNRQSSIVNDNWLRLLALTVGLGLTHHLSLMFMAGVMFLALLWLDRDLLRQPRRWPRPLLFFLLGFLPWLYFLWRGTVGAIGAPDDLTTLRGFFNHVLGLGFRGDVFYVDSWQTLWQRFQVMGNVLTFQFHPLLLVGMAVGLVYLIRKDRQLAFLLGGSFLLHTFITATYRAPQTVEYMLPAYVPLVMMLGYGMGWVSSFEFRVSSSKFRVLSFEFTRHAPRLTYHASRIILALIFFAAASQFFTHFSSYQWLARSSDSRDTVQTWLENAPADSVILAEWHWFTPLRYLQMVEGLRPDVTLQYVAPAGEPYDETWARRIQEELVRGRTVIATHFAEIAYSQLPNPEPYGEAFLFRATLLTELPADFSPMGLLLGEAIAIQGFKLQPAQVEIGQEMVLTVAWSSVGALPDGATLFTHLVAGDGVLLAQADVTLRPQTDGLTLTQFRLTPRPGTAPGDYSLMLGAYRFSLEGLQPLPDEQGQPRTTLTVTTILAMAQAPFTRHPVYRTVPSGRPLLRLVGYDWDFTLAEPRLYLHWQTEQGYQTEVRDGAAAINPILPEFRTAWGRWQPMTLTPPATPTHYVPLGDRLIWLGNGLSPDMALTPEQVIMLPQWLAASQPVLRDYHLSVTLIGYQADSQLWAWRNGDDQDSVPALGAIPTLKWVAGSSVWSPHEVVVDAAAFPGQQIIATLRLYDGFTHQPVPILDERLTQLAPWIPLGRGRLRD